MKNVVIVVSVKNGVLEVSTNGFNMNIDLKKSYENLFSFMLLLVKQFDLDLDLNMDNINLLTELIDDRNDFTLKLDYNEDGDLRQEMNGVYYFNVIKYVQLIKPLLNK